MENPPRRSILATGGVILTGYLTGCLARGINEQDLSATPSEDLRDSATTTADDPSSGPQSDDIESTTTESRCERYIIDSAINITEGETSPVDIRADQNGLVVTAQQSVELTFTAINGGSEPMVIESGAPPPFGVLALQAEDESSEIYPWSEHYANSEYVEATDQKDLVGGMDIGLPTTIEPGETISRTYTLSADLPRFRPGTYSLDKRYTIRKPDPKHRNAYTSMTVQGTVEIDRSCQE